MARVTYLPWGVSIDVTDGATVFEAAQRAGMAIPTACNGKGSCGLCRVRVVSGLASPASLSALERTHLGNVYFVNHLRLSCQIRPDGDLTVEVPDACASGRDGIRGS